MKNHPHASLRVSKSVWRARSARYSLILGLDTLGLCIFLALTNKEDRENTILLIDDVVTSADEAHLERLVGLIHEVASQYLHVILTTHYRPWREKERFGRLRFPKSKFVKLNVWERGKGITATQVDKLPLKILEKHLNDPTNDATTYVGYSGVVLEALLDFLTATYQCSLPRKPIGIGWTIGELMNGIGNKLRDALVVKSIKEDESIDKEEPLGPIIQEIKDMAGLRNLMGCHYNEIGQHLSDSDGRQFTELILKLGKALCDADCGLPVKQKTDYWETNSGRKRLHPLRKP